MDSTLTDSLSQQSTLGLASDTLPNWQAAIAQQDWTAAASLMSPHLGHRLNDLSFVYEYGTVLFHAGQYAMAYTQYLRCNELRPVTADVLNALALAAFMMQNHQLSAHWFEALLRLDPKHLEGRLNLGSALFELGRHEDALLHYDAVIAANPRNAQAYYNRGVVLRQLKRLTDAESSYMQALALQPDYAEAYSNLGVVHHERGQFDRALECYQLARTLRPTYAEAWSNAGATYMALADYSASLDAYNRALSLKADLPSACWNKGILLLLKGDFEAGLPLYEWRFHHQRQALFRRALNLQTPRLDGSAHLQGKTVFLYDEQGLGDAIQMVRYIPLIAARGARVILRVATELQSLFAGIYGLSDMVGDFDDPPAHDFQCPLMSLPLAMGTRLDTIPARTPYLIAATERVNAMERLIEQTMPAGFSNAPRIGLVWAGNPRNPTDAKRSLALSQLLQALPDGPLYISAQKDLNPLDQSQLSTRQNVLIFGSHLSDFADTAALCSCLDALVTVDTSVAHLAGALGIPTLMMISCVPDWRWMLDRDDTPWYPSMRLMRQPVPADWASVLNGLSTLIADIPVRSKALRP